MAQNNLKCMNKHHIGLLLLALSMPLCVFFLFCFFVVGYMKQPGLLLFGTVSHLCSWGLHRLCRLRGFATDWCGKQVRQTAMARRLDRPILGVTFCPNSWQKHALFCFFYGFHPRFSNRNNIDTWEIPIDAVEHVGKHRFLILPQISRINPMPCR